MPRIFLVIFFCFSLSACSWLPFGKDKSDQNVSVEETDEPRLIILVNGVDEEIAKNIRAHVGISKSRCTTPLNLLKRRNRKTVSEVTSALQAWGYYESEVVVEFSSQEDCPVANITVSPGRRMLIDSVAINIDGAASEDSDFEKLIRNIAVVEGNELNHGDYSDTKALIESAAAELGYLDGRFTEATLSIDIEAYVARVLIHYVSGDRYRLGNINISQDPDFLSKDLINRLIEVPEESAYSADRVIDIQNRLLGSGYFKSVEVRPRLSKSEDQHIPLDLTVHPDERHQFQASIGFSTDEGIRSRLGYTNRWWNENGHRLGAETKLSQTEQGFSANYQIPREHPSNEWLQITSGFRRQEVDTFETLAAKLSVTESKRRFYGIMENRFISLSRDDFEIGNETGIATFLIPGVRWNRRFVDDDFYPQHGLDLSFEIRGAADALLSDTSFLRASLNTHYLRALPLGFRAFVRGNVGGMWVDQFRALPPSERFFAGGDNSIRGYDFQDLGPINSSGNVIGGQYLGTVSFELEKYFSANWGAAAFIDTGNAFGGPGDSTGLKTGVGLGARWRSPVGPVRVDLAHPLDDDDTLLKLHIRIGPDL